MNINQENGKLTQVKSENKYKKLYIALFGLALIISGVLFLMFVKYPRPKNNVDFFPFLKERIKLICRFIASFYVGIGTLGLSIWKFKSKFLISLVFLLVILVLSDWYFYYYFVLDNHFRTLFF